jgi:hypothetical protein
MDVTAAMTQVLLADPDVGGVVGGRVFGESVPPDTPPPYVLVRSVTRYPFTRPTTVWWRHALTVDVHSESPTQSFDISLAVEKAMNEQIGSHPDGVVANAVVESTSFFEDGTWTPTRYRNVVSVSVTARD